MENLPDKDVPYEIALTRKTEAISTSNTLTSHKTFGEQHFNTITMSRPLPQTLSPEARAKLAGPQTPELTLSLVMLRSDMSQINFTVAPATPRRLPSTAFRNWTVVLGQHPVHDLEPR